MPATKKELALEWDANILEFWDATLNSFKRCHEDKDRYADPEQVTDDLVKSLPVRPKKAVQESISSMSTKKMSIAPPTPIYSLSGQEEDEHSTEAFKGKEAEEEEQEHGAYDVEDEEQQYAFELNDEDNDEGQPAYIDNIEIPEAGVNYGGTYMEPEQRDNNKRKAAETSVENNSIKEPFEKDLGMKETQRDAKRAKKANKTETSQPQEQYTSSNDNDYHNYANQQPAYEHPPQYPANAMPPPPAPTMAAEGEDSDLSNLIMAWYYAGYYTALYQAKRRS